MLTSFWLHSGYGTFGSILVSFGLQFGFVPNSFSFHGPLGVAGCCFGFILAFDLASLWFHFVVDGPFGASLDVSGFWVFPAFSNILDLSGPLSLGFSGLSWTSGWHHFGIV